IRSLNLKAAAYCGVDLHKIAQARKPVYVEVETGELTRDGIINGLRAGHFTLHGSSLAIPSSGTLTFVQELSIAVKQPLCRPWAGVPGAWRTGHRQDHAWSAFSFRRRTRTAHYPRRIRRAHSGRWPYVRAEP